MANGHVHIQRGKPGYFRRTVHLQTIIHNHRFAPQAQGVFHLVANGVIAALLLIKQPVQALAAFGLTSSNVRHLPQTLHNRQILRVVAVIGILNGLAGSGRLISNIRHRRQRLQLNRQSNQNTMILWIILHLAIHQLRNQTQRNIGAAIHHRGRLRHRIRLIPSLHRAGGQIQQQAQLTALHPHQLGFLIPNHLRVQNILSDKTQR